LELICFLEGNYSETNVLKALSIVPQHSVEPDQEYEPHSAEVYTAPIEIQPPENFVIEPAVDSNVDVLKPQGVLATHKLFKDLSVFQHVDTHVLEVSLSFNSKINSTYIAP